jgi:16S rRNA (guanine966-N2)-methyltransferase
MVPHPLIGMVQSRDTKVGDLAVAQGQIRIIGGAWRGRKIQVPDLPDLRPTPDRVRETLFNWLQPVMSGAYCLDLFAGSGALGFEALSRGAAYVEMVDQSSKVIALLRQQLLTFGAKNAEAYAANVPAQLRAPARPFNVVFLDPPFKENLLQPCCAYLEEKAFLAEDAYIYLESSDSLDESQLPPTWRLLKSKKAGQVSYHLAQRITKEL